MSRWIEPVTLSGQHVSLEPLESGHAAALAAAAADGELYRLWYTNVPNPGDEQAYVDAALAMREERGALPFAVRDLASGDIVGTTRFFNVETAHRRMEIGHTWYAQRVQRTPLNTEAKLLLLGHAFEQLDAVAVEFRTHFMNHRSREAIARLGAKQDGILRNHMIGKGGLLRDTVVFSIIANEWPIVRTNLLFKLGR